MNQYMSGREEAEITILTGETRRITDKLFVNLREDGRRYNDLLVNHCTFANMGFKNAKIIQCDLSHCVFIDCYFKRTYFQNTNFTGCKFINCKFDHITVIACDFRYTTFKDCIMDFIVMRQNLPPMPSMSNIRWELCRNLANESLRLGRANQFRSYFFEEKRACESHYWQMLVQKEEFYKNHYDTVDRLIGLTSFLGSKINKYLWGYGEKISSLLLVISSVIIIFSLIYFLSGQIFSENGISDQSKKSLTFLRSIGFSLSAFFSSSLYYTTTNNTVRFLTTFERILGIVFGGFFVTSLFRYVNRR